MARGDVVNQAISTASPITVPAGESWMITALSQSVAGTVNFGSVAIVFASAGFQTVKVFVDATQSISTSAGTVNISGVKIR